jgi:ribosome-associated toxin RatA of RatAB toxin-antitoxin module
MTGIKFTKQIIINRDSGTVFDYTQDYANRLKWDVFLKRAELIDGATEAGKHVKAYCVAKNGLGMVTEYVTFNRPRVTAIKMTKGPFMFQSFLGSWTFREINPQETEVIFLYSFQLRFPFNLMIPFIKTNLQNNVMKRLSYLKKHIEQG